MIAAIGRTAISSAADVGTLTIQLWRSLLRLPTALPMVGRAAAGVRRCAR
jgi:hypothetical protein